MRKWADMVFIVSESLIHLYQLEDVDVALCDYVVPVDKANFAAAWDEARVCLHIHHAQLVC